MPVSPTLPWFELARFGRSRLTRLAIVAISVVPLLYGGLYIWANVDPIGNLDQVDAAIVNHDELIEITDADGKKQPIAVGRQLAGNLISDDDATNYNWQLTDEADAAAGLADGRYKAVLTIPKNLSKAATSTSGDPAKATQGELDLATNDAVNYINGAIAERILIASREALNRQVTETYLDNVYLGFNDIRMALSEAADAASKLRGGAGDLAEGTGAARDGATQLAEGTRQLADGANQLSDGAAELNSGLNQLDNATSELPAATRRLANGSRQVAAGTAELNDTVQTTTGVVLDATENANSDIDYLAKQLQQLAQACERQPEPAVVVDCAAIRDAASRSGELRGFVGGVRSELNQVRRDSQRLATGAGRVADGNAQLATQVPQLTSAIGQAATGSGRLATGANQVAVNTDAAANGASELATGLGELDDGANQLATGAAKLQAGLADGRDEVPHYSKSDREKLAETAATPVEDAAKRVNGLDNYGGALAPYFMALALWVGAMSIYLLLRPFSRRAVASTAGPLRTALAGFAPGLAIAAVQVGLLLAVVAFALRVPIANPALLVAATVATSITFVAINQMFVTVLGPAGRFAAIVFVCLQLTAAGGTYPVETSPSFFGTVHQLMPMTYGVNLIRAAFAGGGTGQAGDFAALGVFTVGAVLISTLAVLRQQNVSMKQLRPTLVV